MSNTQPTHDRPKEPPHGETGQADSKGEPLDAPGEGGRVLNDSSACPNSGPASPSANPVVPLSEVEKLEARIHDSDNLRHHEQQAYVAVGLEKGLTPAQMTVIFLALAKATEQPVSLFRQMRKDLLNTVASGVIDSAAAAASEVHGHLHRAYDHVVFCEGKLWTWSAPGEDEEGGGGYFSSHGVDEIHRTLLEEYGNLPAMDTQAKREEIVRRVTQMTAEPAFFDDAAVGLAFNNGYLRRDEAAGGTRLEPLTWEQKARSKLLFDWDPDAQAPTFEAGLARLLPEEQDRKAFFEFLGCTFLGASPKGDNERNAALFCGPQKSGKTTLQEIVRATVPAYAVVAVPPALWNNGYHLMSLAGKRVNIVSELGKEQVIRADAFKLVVGGHEVTARPIYGNPETFRCICRHFFACNNLPRFDDPDRSVARRLMAFQLGRSLAADELDVDFLDKVKAELAGVIALCVKHGLEALRRGTFTLPVSQDEVLAEMQHGDDLLARFVIRDVEPAPTSERGVTTGEFTDAMKAAAEREGDTSSWDPVKGKRRLAALLKAIHGAERRSRNGVPFYAGVRLKRRATS